MKPWILILTLTSAFAAQAAVAVKDVTLLGLKLRTANANDVHEHFFRLGGFLQARTTAKQSTVDIFYPWSKARHLYRLEFHYDPNGRFQWAEQRFRYSPHKLVLEHNSMAPITTEKVARQLAEQLGEPQQKRWRQWGGMPGYYRYEWQDETMTVVVDRLDGDPLSPVFVLYRLNRFNYQYVEMEP